MDQANQFLQRQIDDALPDDRYREMRLDVDNMPYEVKIIHLFVWHRICWVGFAFLTQSADIFAGVDSITRSTWESKYGTPGGKHYEASQKEILSIQGKRPIYRGRNMLHMQS